MSSNDAADWLMRHYPVEGDWGHAAVAVRHRSWKREDQIRLARHYFQRLPHASGRAYEAFASFMPAYLLVDILREYMPAAQIDRDLLEYHAAGVLRRSAKTARDREAVRDFLGALGEDKPGMPAPSAKP